MRQALAIMEQIKSATAGTVAEWLAPMEWPR